MFILTKINNDNKQKNKEFNKKSRRLFLLILLLVLMISLLWGATYAWFSSNKHATIESIDINVATITGLQVSVDAINWGNEVTKEQIINAYKTYPRAINQLPDTMSNVSTAGNVTNGKMDMFYGVTSEEKSGGFTLTTYRQDEKQCTGNTCAYSSLGDGQVRRAQQEPDYAHGRALGHEDDDGGEQILCKAHCHSAEQYEYQQQSAQRFHNFTSRSSSSLVVSSRRPIRCDATGEAVQNRNTISISFRESRFTPLATARPAMIIRMPMVSPSAAACMRLST